MAKAITRAVRIGLEAHHYVRLEAARRELTQQQLLESMIYEMLTVGRAGVDEEEEDDNVG